MSRINLIHAVRVVFIFLGTTSLFSCQTPPDGKLQLNTDLEVYKDKETHNKEVTISKGRPIHMPGWAYGQVTKDGDIWGGGPVLFYLGREDLDFSQIIRQTFHKKEVNHEAKSGAGFTAETQTEAGRDENLEEG